MMISNKAELDKCREAAEQELQSYGCRILVCSGTGCIATGSEKIYQKMIEIVTDVLDGIECENYIIKDFGSIIVRKI